MSGRRARLAAAVLALVGAGLASYLAAAKLAGAGVACPTSGCETVQGSRYGELAGVPVALVGAVGYVLIAAAVAAGARAAALALTLAGFLFSMYLLVVQLAVLDAVCVWCVGNDAVITATLAAVLVWLRTGRHAHV